MSRQTKICFVGLDNYPVLNPNFSHCYFGGESVQQSLIAKCLAKRSFSVSMLVKDHGQQKDHVIEGVRCLSTYADGSGLPVIRFVYPKIYSIWQALKQADADVYYQSCADMVTGVVAAFCKFHNKKFIYRLASNYDVEPELLKIRFARDRFMYFWGLQNADVILPQTNYQKEKLKDNFDRTGEIVNMIVSRPSGMVDDRIDVLWVNNIRQVKRADRIYDVAKALPELNFYVIGGAVPGCENEYNAIRSRLCDLQNVTFKGPLPFSETAKYYNSCKVFFNTSDIEGFPNAFLQAWAAGKPIVSLFDPDNLIAKLDLGVAVQSEIDFADAIKHLFSDLTSYEHASKNARQYIAENHSEDVVVNSLCEIIEGIL